MSSACHTEADIFTCGREAARHSERPQVAHRVDLDVDEKVKGGIVCLEPTLSEISDDGELVDKQMMAKKP